MTDILIVGAGVAGMAAAEHLAAAGHAPRLVDKAARPGGRCATRRVARPADADWFDYGAQYFTARHPDFRKQLEPDFDAGRLQRWWPEIASAEQIAGTWLTTPSPDERERLIGPRGLNIWVRERLAAAGLEVDCERRAIELATADGRWRLRYDNATDDHADVVILTAPAPQAATLLGPRAAAIGALSRADEALAPCHSIVVRAPAMADRQALFFKSGALSWAADNSHKAQRENTPHLWTLHADATYSQAHLETPVEQLADALIAEFAAATAQNASAIELVHAHRWRYARPGVGAPDPDDLCWSDATAGLALAGDWLAGGRVEGAWLSGREAARRVIAAF